MESRDELSRILASKFDRRLDAHITDINLSAISRIPAKRIEVDRIGLIEFVSGSAFAEAYDALYISNFHNGERERSDLITERLDAGFAGQRTGLAPYRVIGIRDHSGAALGAAQFSVLFVNEMRIAVPYLQYIYVRSENRRQGLSELLHTLVLAVAMADAGGESLIPFTLFETEPPVHGSDETKRAAAAERTRIHARSGSLALMLRGKEDCGILSAHVQPGLEVGEPPITLIWALRANPAVEFSVLQDGRMGKALVAAYYQSLRDEGFPGGNIALAEGIVEGRYCRAEGFCLVPLGEVGRGMYVGIDG